MNSDESNGSVHPLPHPLTRLPELARNLWWTWNPDAVALFRDLDPAQWLQSGHNPLRMLAEVSTEQVPGSGVVICDYVARCGAVLNRLDAYLNSDADTWFKQTHPADHRQIAYFCAEFGVHESLPIYSGGLGVLAGDHCKTASDLGLPFIAVGLWYTRGYFHQHVNSEGRQIAEPEIINPSPSSCALGADLGPGSDHPCPDRR